jgi:hypothetical protein
MEPESGSCRHICAVRKWIRVDGLTGVIDYRVPSSSGLSWPEAGR